MKHIKKLLLGLFALIMLIQFSLVVNASEAYSDAYTENELSENYTDAATIDENLDDENVEADDESEDEEEYDEFGWIERDGNLFFYVANNEGSAIRRTGWLWYGNHWYFLNVANGYMQTGWVSVNNHWYFLNPAPDTSGHDSEIPLGAMRDGWVSVNGRSYFLNPRTGQPGRGNLPHGAMRDGWVSISGHWYFFNPRAGQPGRGNLPHGAMRDGWVSVNDRWYFLNRQVGQSGHTGNLPHGAMRDGWVWENGNWYFLNPRAGESGRTGNLPHGAMRDGWVWVSGDWFFLNPRAGQSGRTGNLPHGGMRTGWVWQNNSWFFMNNSGRMQRGPVLINGVWHSFNQSGRWRGEVSTLHNDIEATLRRLVAGRSNIGVSYFCLTTGRHISINGNRNFFSASTIKLPTHMMVAEAVHNGSLSWDQELTVTQADITGGSGILQNRVRVGDRFTLYELMRHSIVYSDNIGHRMVSRTVVPNFVGGIGMELTNAVFARYLSGQTPVARMNMTPNQLTQIFRTLHRDQNTIEGYDIIINYMMNTSWRNRFATNLARGHVAHTPGWMYGGVSHDSGLFFTEHPYILVVMTDGIANAPRFLSDISDAVLRLHRNFE